MRTFTAAALVLLTSLAVNSGQASTLSSQDLLHAGDGLVTFDSRTNLQWLDVPATQGVSQYDILDGSGGWIAEGFRYATFEEYKGLLSSSGMVEVGNYAAPSSGTGYFSGSVAVGQALLSLIGSTAQIGGGAALGFIASTPCGNENISLCEPFLFRGQYVNPGYYSYAPRVQWDYSYGAATVPTDGPVYATFMRPDIGSFLVRAVPEPDTYLLLLTGLLLLYFVRKPVVSAKFGLPAG
jgi:hypothetical protein